MSSGVAIQSGSSGTVPPGTNAYSIPVLDVDDSSADDSIVLTWTDAIPQLALGYEVLRFDPAVDTEYNVIATVNALTYTDTSSIPSPSERYYRVRAVSCGLSNIVGVSKNFTVSGDQVNGGGGEPITSVDRPLILLDVGDVGIGIFDNSLITLVSFPALRRCHIVLITNNTNLATATFTSLVTCTSTTSSTSVSDCPVLTSLDFSSMTSAGGTTTAFSVINCQSLPSILMSPSFIFTSVGIYDFSNCAFTEAFEAILLTFKVNTGPTGGSNFNLDGGTNAPDTGTLTPILAILENVPYEDTIVLNP